MKSLILNIPDSLNLNEQEAKNLLAAKLYEKGDISIGQAAELAGYSKRTFMELLHDYGVSLFNYSSSELDNDILNAKSYNS